jgi:rRNA-processing protein FCF1
METYSPLRVALDTSALRRDPRLRGGGFEALARFAEAGYVEVFIPEVVAEEFKTAPLGTAEVFASARKALSDLRRLVPDEAQARVAAFEDDLAGEFAKIEKAARSIFEHWVKRTEANVVPTGTTHGRRALTRYFKGEPPFRGPKARQDIPDGFVLEAIIDLVAEGELLVVTSDKRLAAAAAAIPDVTVFSDTKALIESDHFDDFRQDLLSEYETENIDRVLQALRTNPAHFDADMDDAVSTAVSGRVVSYRNPRWDEKEGEEQVYIDSAGPILEWKLDDAEHEYLGEGVVSVGFEAIVEINLDRSSGDPVYDDLYGSSTDATAEVTGSMSVLIEDEELKRLPFDGIGEKLLASSRVELDEIFDISIREREF